MNVQSYQNCTCRKMLRSICDSVGGNPDNLEDFRNAEVHEDGVWRYSWSAFCPEVGSRCYAERTIPERMYKLQEKGRGYLGDKNDCRMGHKKPVRG